MTAKAASTATKKDGSRSTRRMCCKRITSNPDAEASCVVEAVERLHLVARGTNLFTTSLTRSAFGHTRLEALLQLKALSSPIFGLLPWRDRRRTEMYVVDRACVAHRNWSEDNSFNEIGLLKTDELDFLRSRALVGF